MQLRSKAYKDEQKQDLREFSYIWVYLGIVSREAQGNAKSSSPFTFYSQPEEIYSEPEFEAYYATCEENFAMPGMYFLPRDVGQVALYQGAVTRDILQPITFTFGEYEHLDIKGLTIDFGEAYPTRFQVSNGTTRHYYENTQPGEWVTEDEFLNTKQITITPYEMKGGQQRLRILSIMFGIGVVFDNKSLISTSWKSTVAHLSDQLPSQTFTFTIDNTDKRFAADDPHSYIAFLEEQQEVEFEFGRDTTENKGEEIFRIPGGKLALKSWSSTDQQAKFTAVGKADYITAKYYKGRYYPEAITLYELAEDVLKDAGIEDYVLDTYLKKVATRNPLPIDTHKNLLQLIANTARSVIYEDRKGRLTIKSSFMPEITSVTSSGEREFSNVKNIVKDDMATAEYATAESNFSGVDGHQYFRPRNNAYIEHGYVSDSISNDEGIIEDVSSNYLRFVDENGNVITGLRFVMASSESELSKFIGNGIEIDLNDVTFSNPTVTIEFEAAWTFFNMYLVFSDVVPVDVKIHTFKGKYEYPEIECKELDFETLVEHDFLDIDKIVIEFAKTNPHQRIHLKKVRFGAITDFTLEYRDMKESPTATRTDWTRDVNVHYYEYSFGTEEKVISTIEAFEGENTTTFNKACHGYSLSYKEIIDDEETYSKKSKVFVDSLENINDVKTSTLYFVTAGDGYDEYEYIKTSEVEDFRLIQHVTVEQVGELPSGLSEGILYFVETANHHKFHLYIVDTQSEDKNTISLGYYVDGKLEIISTGAHYVTFSTDTDADVEIHGIEFNVADSITTTRVKEMGDDRTSQNALIDSLSLANKQAKWLAEYYDNDLEYNITYRGEPAIDPDDQIYVENRYVTDNLVRITETQINTSTGMGLTCKLKGRRVSYSEASRVNHAIVNVSEVERG